MQVSNVNKNGIAVNAFIIPISILLMISLLVFGAVEGFYYLLEEQLLPEQRVSLQPAVSDQTPEGSLPEIQEDLKTYDQDVSVITTRNLFASRTGDLEEDSQEEPVEIIEPSSLAIVLMGTVTGPDEEQRAIIYDKTNGRQEMYEKGDYVQQAAISQIMRGRVIISVNGTNELLDISEARKVNVPTIAPQPIVAPVSTLRRVVGRPVGAQRIVQPDEGRMVEPQSPDSAGPGEMTAQ